MKRTQRQILRRLIRQRSETSGALLKKEKSWDQRGIGSIRAKLARIDAEIASLSPELDIQDIRPLKLVQPAHTSDIHRFTDNLLSLLIETAGEPISTAKLREQMQQRFGFPHETAAQRKRISIMISQRLFPWEKKGAVQRVHCEGTGRSNCLWVWVGL